MSSNPVLRLTVFCFCGASTYRWFHISSSSRSDIPFRSRHTSHGPKLSILPFMPHASLQYSTLSAFHSFTMGTSGTTADRYPIASSSPYVLPSTAAYIDA